MQLIGPKLVNGSLRLEFVTAKCCASTIACSQGKQEKFNDVYHGLSLIVPLLVEHC